MDLSRELLVAVRLAREAGAVALRHRGAGVSAEEKPDDAGPVTAADKECDALIRGALAAEFPADGLLTEETPDDGAWRTCPRVWMVDPIDGTKEFIRGGDEFAAMVGLSIGGVPAVGAVYKPEGDVMYAAARGMGAWREHAGVRTKLACPAGIPDPLVVAVSKSHRSQRLDDLLAGLGPLTALPSGSVGLKVALIAEGRASAYLNAARRSCLWDSCAPAAILQEAGGTLTDLAGRPLSWADGLEHQQGLFCATAAVHAHLRDRVRDTARAVAGALALQPHYPRDAFLFPSD